MQHIETIQSNSTQRQQKLTDSEKNCPGGDWLNKTAQTLKTPPPKRTPHADRCRWTASIICWTIQHYLTQATQRLGISVQMALKRYQAIVATLLQKAPQSKCSVLLAEAELPHNHENTCFQITQHTRRQKRAWRHVGFCPARVSAADDASYPALLCLLHTARGCQHVSKNVGWGEAGCWCCRAPREILMLWDPGMNEQLEGEAILVISTTITAAKENIVY